eukprot:TRINITY_DN45798_c0_g1_i2.p4 TRINITY_DN45798_c0_g1~~TRINITY_DN45798_c0_g1_i2.p4  ORF type:complete len:205 (+),score=46.65 TRINITY_DN45798_c0_g1_i2:51-665(+)
MIGHKIRRFWPYNPETGDLEGWYTGIIAEYNKERNEFCIVYDYGDPEKESQEWFNPNTASREEYQILDEVFVPEVEGQGGQQGQGGMGQVHASPKFVNQNGVQQFSPRESVKKRPDLEHGTQSEQLQLQEFNKKLFKMDRVQLVEEELRLVAEQLQVREEIELLKYSLRVSEMKDLKEIQTEQEKILREQETLRNQLAELKQTS